MTAPSRPLAWAEAIAARSLALQEQGYGGEEAWCLAAGVPRARGTGPSARERIVAWIAEQEGPVTSSQAAEALELSEGTAASVCRAAEHRGELVLAGTIARPGRPRQVLWRVP